VIQQPSSAPQIITPEPAPIPKIVKPEPQIIVPPKPAPIISKPTPIVSETSQQIGKFIVQDGVATDTETGLMWLRFAHGQQWESIIVMENAQMKWLQFAHGQRWNNGSVKGTAKKVSWHDAIKIPTTFSYGNYNDWRVPSIDELEMLIDKGEKGNYIDSEVFPKNNGEWFWSSSPFAAGSKVFAWYVYFGSGVSNYFNKDSYGYIRLVRG
jgi:hypothetical protein